MGARQAPYHYFNDGSVHDGELWLTEGGGSVERSFVGELPLLSGWRFFEASFDVSLGGGGGGEGMSVCVGVLPNAPFGERGAGDGLRVLLLTRGARVEEPRRGESAERSRQRRQKVQRPRCRTSEAHHSAATRAPLRSSPLPRAGLAGAAIFPTL